MGRHLHLFRRNPCAKDEERSKLDILADQLIDALIVGGIAGLSAYVAAGADASVKSAFVAFVLTFLVKLKEYRGIK